MKDSETQGPPIEYISLLNNFYIISRLGLGSFGQALLAKRKKTLELVFNHDPSRLGTMMFPSGQKLSRESSAGLVAIKVMKSSLKKPKDCMRITEVRFIYSMSAHFNLIQIFHVFIDSMTGKLCIAMEAMNQNLYQLMQKHNGRSFPQTIVKSMLAQILNAVRHIHSKGFFHRDIKPENILVTPTLQYYGLEENIPPSRRKDFYIVKLCDYGLARHINNPKELTPYVSTRWYRAPEILLRQRNYSRPIDIWAFASVAVELINGRPMFAGHNEAEQMYLVLSYLGHPTSIVYDDDLIGGYWAEGAVLVESLGIQLPYGTGISIHKILPQVQYTSLAKALKNCFAWDPALRPTAFELSLESFFRGTILEEDPNHFRGYDLSPIQSGNISPREAFSSIPRNYPSEHMKSMLNNDLNDYSLAGGSETFRSGTNKREVGLKSPFNCEDEKYPRWYEVFFDSSGKPIPRGLDSQETDVVESAGSLSDNENASMDKEISC